MDNFLLFWEIPIVGIFNRTDIFIASINIQAIIMSLVALVTKN